MRALNLWRFAPHGFQVSWDRTARRLFHDVSELLQFLIAEFSQVQKFLLLLVALDLRQHRAERFQTLAHFAQRHNRASVVAVRFRPGKQFPSLALNSPHFIEQGFTETRFVLSLGLADRIGDVVLVP